ncbi:MAG: LapA family protein [Pirellulaceae bacterium]|nr:LapA family protein [Pirellulaceae bacterium]
MLTGTLNKLKVVAIAAVTLLVLVVVLQNTQAVETHLLFLTLTMPNAALLFGALIVGFAIGVLTAGHLVAIAKRALPSNEPKGTSRATPDIGEDIAARAL